MFVCLNVSCCDIWVVCWIGLNFNCNEWDGYYCSLKWYFFYYSFDIEFLSGLGFFLRNLDSFSISSE